MADPLPSSRVSRWREAFVWMGYAGRLAFLLSASELGWSPRVREAAVNALDGMNGRGCRVSWSLSCADPST